MKTTWRLVSSAAALALVATLAVAGDTVSQFNIGESFFFSSTPCPAKQVPTFESLVPVPNIIDPFEQDMIPMFCEIEVSREGMPVKKVKGKYTSELVVRDNVTGETESFPAGSGRFKTNADGHASFDFELPAELFADGFESGDVSAWSYTRTDFKRRKQVNDAYQRCGVGSSSSSQ